MKKPIDWRRAGFSVPIRILPKCGAKGHTSDPPRDQGTGITLQRMYPAHVLHNIKAAWRKTCQQYHPDKRQGLPERFKQVVELETKRINDAFQYLERVTAADF